MKKISNAAELQERLQQKKSEEIEQIEAIIAERNEKFLKLLSREYSGVLSIIKKDMENLRQKSWAVPVWTLIVCLVIGGVAGWMLAPKSMSYPGVSVLHTEQGRYLLLPSDQIWQCGENPCVRLQD